MPDPSLPVLDWMSGTGYRLVLLVGLLGAAGVGWTAWRRTRSPASRMVWLGALSVLAGLSVWALFGGLARVLGLDPGLWAAPLDRLLGVAMLVALGWTLVAPGFGGRRWRVFLAGGLAAAALAYLGWAPLWAQAFRANPGLARDATGLARAWDLWLVVLALAVGVALLRGPRPSRWVLGVVAGLAIGSFLEVVVPLSATVPAWSRLGTLVAGSFIVAAAASQVGTLRPGALDLAWPLGPVRLAGSRRHPPSPTPAATPPADGPGHAPAAAPAAPLAPAPSAELDRVLAELGGQARALATLTVSVQALADRLEQLERPAAPPAPGPTETAPPSGPPRAEPATGPLPVLPAERDLTVAAVAALEAATTARATLGSGAGEPTLDVLATQSRRYERALAQLPWGVVVTDGDDRVAFANPAAADLLHLARIQPGEPAAPLFPSDERLGYALLRARQATAGSTPGLELHFESPGLRVEVEPLRDPLAGYLGAVLVLYPRAGDAGGLAESMVPALAEALRAPMTSILGYSELLNRMTGLSDDQVQRYLQRIDANLSRMQVMLGNLLTVMSLAEARPPEPPEAVDVEAAVRTAVSRAQPQFGEKGLAVNVAVNGPLPPASADPRAVTQIMDNLLAEAALRSPQGGDVAVEAGVRDDGHGQRAVVISVRDRGSQLAAGSGGVLEIDAAAPRQVSLTVVRLLAERQGGRAWAETNATGAGFHVRLPLRRAA